MGLTEDDKKDITKSLAEAFILAKAGENRPEPPWWIKGLFALVVAAFTFGGTIAIQGEEKKQMRVEIEANKQAHEALTARINNLVADIAKKEEDLKEKTQKERDKNAKLLRFIYRKLDLPEPD